MSWQVMDQKWSRTLTKATFFVVSVDAVPAYLDLLLDLIQDVFNRHAGPEVLYISSDGPTIRQIINASSKGQIYENSKLKRTDSSKTRIISVWARNTAVTRASFSRRSSSNNNMVLKLTTVAKETWLSYLFWNVEIEVQELTFRDRMKFGEPFEQVQQIFRVLEVVAPFRRRRFLHTFVRAIP